LSIDGDLPGKTHPGGRSKTWLKTKCFTQSTFVVIGMDRDRKTGALRALLAHKDSAGLSYAGAAFIALAGNERARFFADRHS
jgi:ATP-dependent DNA ligase